ncbi:alpha-L-arabinofuranosidase C-terminal domain-containing protein, partial [Anaerovibrio lipolyticus]|uniref:alpha-L-arabinofuranosidase C-terminal domain-containing protein n=2 Tax=Bacillota TaxID=1239 RepID=UPI0023A99100
MEDSLLFASMMMVLLKKCDRVKIGCQSLLTNISACIMTKKGGEAWVQPIYFPFELIANNAVGTV